MRYERQTYPTVVNITGKPADIDFKTEFKRLSRKSRQGESGPVTLVSRRLAAMADSYACIRNNYTHTQLYGYAFNESVLTTEMVNIREKLPHALCIKTPNFKDSLVVREYEITAPGPPVTCKVRNLTASFSGSERFAVGNATQFGLRGCAFEVKKMYCFRTDFTACAGIGRGPGEGYERTFAVLVPNIGAGNAVREGVIEVGSVSEEDERKIAENIAFFSAIGLQSGVANMANMAITEIRSNVSLYHMVGNEEISEIDMRIVVPVLSFVAATTTLLVLAASILWFLVMYNKGRRRYNTFSSVSEMLQLANPAETRKERVPWGAHPYIGIGKYNPAIMVVGPKAKEECVDAEWRESEICLDLTPE